MSLPNLTTNLPINLTAALLHAAVPLGASRASSALLHRSSLGERLDGSRLRAQGQALATQHEIYLVAAGHGGIRCEDDSLLEVTAGDLVYVTPGTRFAFETLSRKFSALRLTIPAAAAPTDPD